MIVWRHIAQDICDKNKNKKTKQPVASYIDVLDSNVLLAHRHIRALTSTPPNTATIKWSIDWQFDLVTQHQCLTNQSEFNQS